MAISESFSLKSGDFGKFSSTKILFMNPARFIFVVKWQNFAKKKKKKKENVITSIFLKEIFHLNIPFFLKKNSRKNIWFNFTKSLIPKCVGT
jgi:hypothetical protein